VILSQIFRFTLINDNKLVTNRVPMRIRFANVASPGYCAIQTVTLAKKYEETNPIIN